MFYADFDIEKIEIRMLHTRQTVCTVLSQEFIRETVQYHSVSLYRSLFCPSFWGIL